MNTFEKLYEHEQSTSHFYRIREELPLALKEILFANIPANGKVLVPDGEQIIYCLDEILNKFPKTTFNVCFSDITMFQKAKLIKGYSNLVVTQNPLPNPLKLNEEFDFIFTVPPFKVRGNYKEMGYSSNDYCISLLEELTSKLTEKGKLIAITLQGITFTLQSKIFRTNIINNFKLVRVDSLPPKLFRTASVKTSLIEIERGKTDEVLLTENTLGKNAKLENTDSITVSANDLLEEDSWDISKFQIFGDKTMKQYKSSTCEKCLLENIATDIFRGRSDLKYIEDKKGVFVLNISDIRDSVVNFDNLKVIENDRNNRKYELENGDILMTSRGTDVRTAVFYKPDDEQYIASAGLIVIRLKDKNLANYVQIFFESKIGKMLLDSLKSGATILNIVPAKVKELTIPMLPKAKISDLLLKYNETMDEFNEVKEKAKKMVEKEQIKLDNYYNNFTEELLK